LIVLGGQGCCQHEAEKTQYNRAHGSSPVIALGCLSAA
jgi:hypothetical protein